MRRAGVAAPALMAQKCTLIFVPPFTLFSKELAMEPGGCAAGVAGVSQKTLRCAGSKAVEQVAAKLRCVYRGMPAQQSRRMLGL